MKEDYLTVKEAAELLKCHPNTVKNRIYDGTIKAKKFANSWRIKRSTIERLMK